MPASRLKAWLPFAKRALVIENVNTEPFRAAAYEPVRKMYAEKFGADILTKIDALK